MASDHASASEAAPPATARSRLRIAHIITRFIRGGADENTLLTCNGQAELGHEVILAHGGEFHPQMLERLDRRVHSIEVQSLQRSLHAGRDIACFFSLFALLRRLRPDLVHTHESKAGVLGRLAARACGVPCVVHGVHILAHLNESWAKGALYHSAEWCAAQCTDLFIDVSEALRTSCVRAGLGNADRHIVVESGMPIEAYRPGARRRGVDARDLGPRYAREAMPVLILIAGALEPRKRVSAFLDVFADLANDFPQACLAIAGEGPEQARLEAKVVSLGLEDRVVLVGHREDLAEWIAMADICVHCAEREGLPRVVVQYVAAGKPVVCADLSGLTRVVRHGVNGFLTALEDVAAMRAPLEALVADRAMRARMGAAAAETDLSAWSVESMLTRIDEAYEATLTRNAALANRVMKGASWQATA